MGIKVDENWSQLQKLQHVMEEISKQGAGLLEERAEGLTGQFKGLENATDSLMKGFGRAIANSGLFQNAVHFLTEGLQNMEENLFGSGEAAEAAGEAAGDYAKTADQVANSTAKVARSARESAEELDRMRDAAREAQEQLEDMQKEQEGEESHQEKMLKAREKYDMARIRNATKSGVITDDQADQLEYMTRTRYAQREQAMEQAGYRKQQDQNKTAIRQMDEDLAAMAPHLSPEQFSMVMRVIMERQSKLGEKNRQLGTQSRYSAEEFGADMAVSTAEAGQAASQHFGRLRSAVETYAGGINGRLDELGQLFLVLDRRIRNMR